MVEEVRASVNYLIHMKSVTHHFSRANGLFFSLSLQDLHHLSIMMRDEGKRIPEPVLPRWGTAAGSTRDPWQFSLGWGSHTAEREPVTERQNEELDKRCFSFCLSLDDQ